MKILHVLDHSLPLHSGYTFRSRSIFEAQKKMGFHPVVVTSPKHEQSWKGESPAKETISGVDYYRTGAVPGSKVPFLSEIKLMRALEKRLLEVARIEKPDVIHAHSPILNAFPALKVGKKLGIPVVYEIRAFWEDAAVDHGTYAENSIKYRITKALETRACRKADHIAILCNGLKQDLIARGIPAEKITPVFNGVNVEDFKPTPPDAEYLEQWSLEGKKVIGFIGSFYRYEGLDLLVKAFARIAPKHPDAVLLLVGGGEMDAELKALVKQIDEAHSSQLIADEADSSQLIANEADSSKLIAHRFPSPSSSNLDLTSDLRPLTSGRLRDRVIFPGRIPHERIPGIYSMVDILAYPRYPMRLTELVTPLKPLEAMAMGKALVASDVGGHKELIRHDETGVLFPAGNEEKLAEVLDDLLKDSEKRRQLQETGYTWVREHHTWEKTTAVYRKIYDGILNS